MNDEGFHNDTLWTGQCLGGPMNGQVGESRFPKGFLLVDRPANRVWIYDFVAGDDVFQVRDESGTELISDPDAERNRFRAAEESKYDIRAAEPREEVAG